VLRRDEPERVAAAGLSFDAAPSAAADRRRRGGIVLAVLVASLARRLAVMCFLCLPSSRSLRSLGVSLGAPGITL
jgi:hypothetical protein